ncbi:MULTISPECIES: O-antigen ligase [unclassified Psychrobacter]|uniref:O-antigen ligase family protein n=1 Tax=unclassified Psychrobacter TaxID=196806 RepID=UPI0025F8B42B|nr:MULTISPECIES: O-antigen ligase family protein [unclassified Psychrobacter]
MPKNKISNKQESLHSLTTCIRTYLTKELLIVFYFLLFIFGITSRDDLSFYNEYRVIEVALLLIFALMALLYRRLSVSKVELFFFAFIAIGGFFWAQPAFVITELFLAYLLYQCFKFLNYRQLTSKTIVLASITMFIQLPFALWDYIATGNYQAIWYPLRWNIRVYDSYFLILSVFAVWFYLTKQAYRYLYLLFLFLAFFAILLDAGRSATIAYTLFTAIVCIAYRHVRWHFIFVYAASWLAYLSVTYAASFANTSGSDGMSLQVARESSSGRIDLWVNAYHCWSQHPIIGCGFYQLEQYPNLSAHPHNLFIQVLTEIGLLGFGFLIYIIFMIIKRIDWSQPHSYFVMAALLAVGVDLFFSGVHIYPVTQMALLWLFVFLLKSPQFSYSSHFNQVITHRQSMTHRMLPVMIYLVISIWFIYLLSHTNALSSETPITPPRFWVYGYQL